MSAHDCRPTEPKITVELIGTDGNAFALIGRVAKGLRKAGRHDDAKAFIAKATACHSYDEVLRLIMETVEIE